MSSGDEDTWENVAETIEDNGSLILLGAIEGDELPAGIKTVTMSQEIDNGPDLPPSEKHTTFQVLVIYAPGMWMKAEFDA